MFHLNNKICNMKVEVPKGMSLNDKDYINSLLEKTTQKVKLNNNQLKIVDFIKENPKITRIELANKLNITVDGVKYNLKKLIDNDIIERIGPDNGGYWSIK